jgi:WD40 repeat protein
MTIGDGDSQVFTMKFDDNDEQLACGYGDGMTRIYNCDSGKLSYTLADYKSESTVMPVTALLWRPQSSTVKTSNMLVAAYADGWLRHWHVTSGKLLHQTYEEPENHIYCMDFNHDGSFLATAGRDSQIRIYDENTKQLAF